MIATHRFVLAAFLVALTGFVGACATTRAVDTSGQEISLDKPHIAEHLQKDRIVVYQNAPADIDRLIADLRQSGFTDPKTLNRENWTSGLCQVVGNKCSVSHCGGTVICALVSWTPSETNIPGGGKGLGFRYCECR